MRLLKKLKIYTKNNQNKFMNYEYLLYSFLFALGSFVYYKFNKWTLKDRNGIKNPDEYSKPSTIAQIINSWFVIIILIIASIVYFFKAIG